MRLFRHGQGERHAEPRVEGLPDFDPLLLAALVLLVAIGAVMVYSASAVEAGRKLGDEFHYLKRQLVAAVLGSGLLLLALKKGHRWAARLAYPLLAVTLFALVLVKLIGKTAGGAQRWIPLGPVNLQPAELAKVALVLYLAHSLARKQGKVRLFSIGLLPHLLVTLAMVGLCLWQRDLGTGFILFVVLFAMLFAAGAKVGYLFGMVLLAAPAGWHIIKSTEYRYQRWLAFMNPEQYKTTFGFQLWESLLGTANGGWLGQGLGQGKGKLFYLPAAHTDFIAAVIAEEAGLIGILLLLTLYAVVIWRGVRAALRAAEPFGCYAAFGVTVLVAAQALVNLGVVFGLLPTKGLTLPFVSYGGSSLITLLFACGVLLSVSADRGGFLARPAAAVRVGAPIGGAPRLSGPRADAAGPRSGEAA
jgi:cell division protein FtsW